MLPSVRFNTKDKVFVNTDGENVKLKELRRCNFPWTYVGMFTDILSKTVKVVFRKVLNIDDKLYNTLFDYQQEDVNRVINTMGGRALLGHEMVRRQYKVYI